ncbi:hypothetical protein A7J57_23655 [Agrobacterium tumefaciens]|uniref:Uncharacterized protein n=1 Tax=Agrobacterium tumefaciens TaxID=358 RepID=A0A176X1K7_AGRTU|nr:hypothetical protein A7J57_23655 [Agrobacterium tumefaciens]
MQGKWHCKWTKKSQQVLTFQLPAAVSAPNCHLKPLRYKAFTTPTDRLEIFQNAVMAAGRDVFSQIPLR